MEILPPPPYSETDPGSMILTPSTSHADNASRRARSAVSPSETESVVYTPPYSPTDAGHQSVAEELNNVSSAAATAYFESRPALRPRASIPQVHTLTITSTTEPKDIPYPQELGAYDTTEQDWATFLNFLFPDHASSINGDIADRKLAAELEYMRITEEKSLRSDMSHVEAQLEPLRQTPEATSQAAERLGERLNRIDATITEWNTGFFEPRSLQIRFIEPEITIDGQDETRAIPGAWIPYDHEISGEPSAGDPRPARRGFSFAGIEAGPQGFRLGPIRAVCAPNKIHMVSGNRLLAVHQKLKVIYYVKQETDFSLGPGRISHWKEWDCSRQPRVSHG